MSQTKFCQLKKYHLYFKILLRIFTQQVLMELNFAFSTKPVIQTHCGSADQSVNLEKSLAQIKSNSTNPIKNIVLSFYSQMYSTLQEQKIFMSDLPSFNTSKMAARIKLISIFCFIICQRKQGNKHLTTSMTLLFEITYFLKYQLH